MIVRVSDNIISPLGMTTAENYTAVKAGRSELKRHDGLWQLPETFTASLMDREAVNEKAAQLQIDDRYTFFEKMIILSAAKALEQTDIDPTSDSVLFILSTTKGNVFLLDKPTQPVKSPTVLCASSSTPYDQPSPIHTLSSHPAEAPKKLAPSRYSSILFIFL